MYEVINSFEFVKTLVTLLGIISGAGLMAWGCVVLARLILKGKK